MKPVACARMAVAACRSIRCPQFVRRTKPRSHVRCLQIGRHPPKVGISPYFSTLTPFQNATYPLMCFAASFGSG